MKMKKLSAALLSVAVALLAGCGEKNITSLSDNPVASSLTETNDTAESYDTSDTASESSDTSSDVSDPESSNVSDPESSDISDTSDEASEQTASQTQSEPQTSEESASVEHNHKFTLTKTVAATCTEAGYELYTCSCGEEETKTSKALGHSYKKTVTEATCTDGGYTTYTCTRCGHSYKDGHTAALGHNYISRQTVKPTCTKEGYTVYRCSRCDHKYIPKDEYTSAQGHSWGDWTVTKAATTSSEGVKTSVCANCGEKKTASIDKLKADVSTYASEVVKLVNEERAKQGLSPLTADSELMKYAQLRSTELVDNFAHQRPDGSSPLTYVMSLNGIHRAGENIAWGQRTPNDVMTSWMNSSGHRANILNSDYTKIGVGCYEYNGSLYWTQIFAG